MSQDGSVCYRLSSRPLSLKTLHVYVINYRTDEHHVTLQTKYD